MTLPRMDCLHCLEEYELCECKEKQEAKEKQERNNMNNQNRIKMIRGHAIDIDARLSLMTHLVDKYRKSDKLEENYLELLELIDIYTGWLSVAVKKNIAKEKTLNEPPAIVPTEVPDREILNRYIRDGAK